jgi:hypothetical protein
MAKRAKKKTPAGDITVTLTQRQLMQLLGEMRPGAALRFLAANPEAAHLLPEWDLNFIARRAAQHTHDRIRERLAGMGIDVT